MHAYMLTCIHINTSTRLRIIIVWQATFEDGQLIFQQGHQGQHFFIIQSGEVVCSARKNWQDVHEQPKVCADV
jgi:uncharacterized protein (DUF2062 family)